MGYPAMGFQTQATSVRHGITAYHRGGNTNIWSPIPSSPTALMSFTKHRGFISRNFVLIFKQYCYRSQSLDYLDTGAASYFVSRGLYSIEDIETYKTRAGDLVAQSVKLSNSVLRWAKSLIVILVSLVRRTGNTGMNKRRKFTGNGGVVLRR